ncbi:DUF6502 family protein [Ruegeria sp. 2205SS24-7]|uniref:DUF6502 family protein n=1 Tax=Ruegeria discodermiae TaxID=3064389 RepID=UPI0027412775|nr:DUF6502 family protein [Ruegeria sp. 2205SS24-7]MDP5219755.1 DUF6502 family protein [Ruegeria sp. 2205SS24-7]
MSSQPKPPLETALAALLEPLAQAMVAHGVTLGTATEALKKALLAAAESTSASPLSDSRASLLTGLHRKDVKRLRGLTDDAPEKRSSNAAALVISHWATSPEYQDASGAPRDLSRKGGEDGPGFDDLVRLARIDMAPGTVLNTLLDHEIVETDETGNLRLLTHAFLASGGGAEQVAAYQATLSAHLRAATQNLLAAPGDARNFDRAVRYSHLSLESIEQLRQLSEEQAQTLLQDINALARTLQDRDESGGHRGRFVMGAYILPSPAKTAEKDPEEGDET